MSSEEARQIAKHLKKNPEATIPEISAALSIDPDTVTTILDEYHPDGEHAGPGKGGGWTEQ